MARATQGAARRAWGAVLLPVRCPGCGALDEVVCAGCRDAVLRGPLRPRPLADGTVVVASAPWRGPARGLVVAAKEQGRRDVVDVLALATARAVVGLVRGGPAGDGSWPVGALVLAAPPSRTSALLRRRARPADELARATARLLRAAGADVRAVDWLRHTRRVHDQAGLDRAERAENLDGALAVRARHARRSAGAGRAGASAVEAVVVDDVLTTGATVMAAVAALRAAGVPVLGGAVVASA